MSRPELHVLNGELVGRHFAVEAGGLRLGRSSSNDIHIPDEELSRNHCLFEQSGEAGLRVTDLSSANGTFVNGVRVGDKPVNLAEGDVIEAGSVKLRVGGDGAAVDLGLGARGQERKGPPDGESAVVARKRPKWINLVWCAVAALLVAATCIVLNGGLFSKDDAKREAMPQRLAEEVRDRVLEMEYEKVSADAQGVFRYAMTLARDGVLTVSIDSAPQEDRHVVRSERLNEKALARLNEILLDPALAKVDPEYSGVEGGGRTLESRKLKVIRTDRVQVVRVVNAEEPAAFAMVRERLEAFTKNELGLWAIQYSISKLQELAKGCAETGRTKWEDRDVEYGNLQASVKAYREAIFYLETINPKPAIIATYRTALEKSEKELEARYKEQRFRVDRAINLSDWETARAQLGILLELVPDRDDERYREAASKLVDVERRLGEGRRQ